MALKYFLLLFLRQAWLKILVVEIKEPTVVPLGANISLAAF